MSGSSGELKIESILTAANLPFEREYEFPDLVASSGRPLRMDFVVFEDDGTIAFAIEYDGEQHYNAVKHFGGQRSLNHQHYNDLKKNQYCLDHSIPLVRIPYWDYDKINLEYILNRANFF
jgi:hypothetical protein